MSFSLMSDTGSYVNSAGSILDFTKVNKYGTGSIPLVDYMYNMFGQNTAQQNNSFNEFMSSTQYQRAIQDMKAAGLNSALMYSSSQNASPSASSGGNPMQVLAPIVNGIFSLCNNALRINSAENVARDKIESQEDIARDRIATARDIANLNVSSASKVANIRAKSAKNVADMYVKSRRENRSTMNDVRYYRDKFGDYHKFTEHFYEK